MSADFLYSQINPALDFYIVSTFSMFVVPFI